MLLQQGVDASLRRPIAIACAVVAFLAIAGALAYASLSVGDGCGNGLSAVHKPLPDPLLTDAEQAAIKNEKRNPYEAALAKSRPIEDCRRAGTRQLVTAGLGSSVLLIPVIGVMGFVFLPRRRSN